MCGIFGFVLRSATRDLPDLDVAVRSLWHRGPDDQGRFDLRADDFSVGFAHTRLSIVDLSAGGHQPMASADGRFVVVYNGEIYNFAEIRRELEALGESFRSNCDTEVLVVAWSRWGKASLPRFRGMFAFAIWDNVARTLVLVRDRIGVKPLYYVERPDGVVFSSELRALLETQVAARRLSPDGLASYLAFGAVREPHTILRDVRALPSGCALELKNGAADVERYWKLPLKQNAGVPRAEIVRELRATLLESVRLRLVADVPVGVFLSGGIDSAAVVALASIASDAPVHSFTVAFDGANSEEEPARQIAQHFGCVHRTEYLSTSDISSEIETALGCLDQPSADGMNTYFVSKAARAAGLAVALSGIGGDELFAGYSSFRRFARIRALNRLVLPQFARRSLDAVQRGPRIPIAIRKSLALVSSDGSIDSTYDVLRSFFTPSQRDALIDTRLFSPHSNGVKTLDGDVDDALARGDLDAMNAYAALELSNYLAHTLLRDADAMSMAHSLEVREPLLDHLLVEYAMGVPSREKTRGTGNKPLLTEAVPEVPMASRLRRKSGFDLPFDAWLRGPLRDWAHARIAGDVARRMPWLKGERANALLRAFDARSAGVSASRIWCMAVLVDWCARHRIEV